MAAAHRATLLTLPLEIRLQIYSHLFALTKDDFCPATPGPYLDDIPDLSCRLYRNRLSILLACRQVHREARDLAFRNTVFRVLGTCSRGYLICFYGSVTFYPNGEYGRLCARVERMGLAAREAVRYATVLGSAFHVLVEDMKRAAKRSFGDSDAGGSEETDETEGVEDEEEEEEEKEGEDEKSTAERLPVLCLPNLEVLVVRCTTYEQEDSLFECMKWILESFPKLRHIALIITCPGAPINLSREEGHVPCGIWDGLADLDMGMKEGIKTWKRVRHWKAPNDKVVTGCIEFEDSEGTEQRETSEDSGAVTRHVYVSLGTELDIRELNFAELKYDRCPRADKFVRIEEDDRRFYG